MAGSEGSLQEILDEIQELEKTKILSEGVVIYDELYQTYLLIGLILLLLSEIFRKYFLKEVV